MAETLKHTPGPWLNAGRSAGAHIHADNGEVAWLRSYVGIADEEINANAHLITAAPDLLEALKQCRDAMHADNPADGWLEIITSANDAISKAEGRS